MSKNFIIFLFMMIAVVQIVLGIIFSTKGSGSLGAVLSLHFGILLLYLTIRDVKKGGWK